MVPVTIETVATPELTEVKPFLKVGEIEKRHELAPSEIPEVESNNCILIENIFDNKITIFSFTIPAARISRTPNTSCDSS